MPMIRTASRRTSSAWKPSASSSGRTGRERERPGGMSAVDADDLTERGERIAESMTEALALATPRGQALDAGVRRAFTASGCG